MTELERTVELFAGMGLAPVVETDQTLEESYEEWRAHAASEGRTILPEDDVKHTVPSIAADACAPEEVLASRPKTMVTITASHSLDLFFDEGGRYVGMSTNGVPDGFWPRGTARPITATDLPEDRRADVPS